MFFCVFNTFPQKLDQSKYEDPDFSITHLPLIEERLDALNSALDILRQLQVFPQLASSIDIISKLNEHISRQTGMAAPAMDMEHVSGYRGAQFIGKIYDAVRNKQTLVIEYQSFKARKADKIVVYPYLLKEYRNRWFLICEKASNRSPQVNIFALDRIHSVEIDRKHPYCRLPLHNSLTLNFRLKAKVEYFTF